MESKSLDNAAINLRVVMLDAVEAAASGHPGMPLGCAELGTLLFSEVLTVTPDDPSWIDRDRFVLSAGHGSILLYALLHSSGFNLGLDDLEAFRQYGSRTPGHPEFGVTDGVDVTTGPLGQGLSAAVGMAIAERLLAARLNTSEISIIDHYTYVIAGDGDLMEGVSYEATSLAGHLGLGRLLVFYDANGVTIDGPLSLSFSEDVPARFESCGWQVMSADPYDYDTLLKSIARAKSEESKPTLIVLPSVIGKGSPTFSGRSAAHGGAFGADEVARIKEHYGFDPGARFQMRDETYAVFSEARRRNRASYQAWQKRRSALFAKYPEKERLYAALIEGEGIEPVEPAMTAPGVDRATRMAVGDAVREWLGRDPGLVGGSADLTTPCFGKDSGFRTITRDDFSGNYLRFGVREHAMAAISNGIALHKGLRVFCATFLAFSDYLRPSLRLAAIMGAPVIYVFTHDSILIGQDGPTHQPIEHLAALRAIPGLQVVRPADADECAVAWNAAMEKLDGPCALILTRQEVTTFRKPAGWEADMVRHGCYVVREGGESPAVTIVASGSEVAVALDAVDAIGRGDIRVVSMSNRERFSSSDESDRRRMIPEGTVPFLFEAGRKIGWDLLLTERLAGISIECFGRSAPLGDMAREYGIDQAAVKDALTSLLATTDRENQGVASASGSTSWRRDE